jgi:PAS domain S-box-containing protein
MSNLTGQVAHYSILRNRASTVGRNLCLTIAGIFLCLPSSPLAAAQQKAKNVLVLFSFLQRQPASLELTEASIRARVPWPVNFSVAYLENPRFEEKSYRESLAETLRRGYGGEKPDLVMTASEPALRFATEYRDTIFPGVPIVFWAISSGLADQKMPGVTGVSSATGVRDTIDLALRLQPDTAAIAVITSVSETERDWLTAVHAELLRHQDKIREIDLVGTPGPQLLEGIAALPPHTVALFQLFPHDSDQPAIGTWDVLAVTTERLPTYSIFPALSLDRGGIGGAYYDDEKDCVLAGELAARVLKGERPDTIPVVHISNPQVRVDWRALRRWNIPESALPAGSLVLYREPTLWQRYRGYVVAALMVMFAQAFLIAGLLWQRARKRKAEAILRESEERFRLLAETTPAMIWMCDAEGKITYVNSRGRAFSGPDATAGYGDKWMEYIHPDDLPRMLNTIATALKVRRTLSYEYRLRRSDGEYRWMYDVASPRVNGDGSFAGFIGSAIDTTDQKLAKQALERVSGQLIEAQEKERRRIARELHDDICQRLGLLSLEIDQANRLSNGSHKNLEVIRNHCAEIADEVQALSGQLHSSKLDYLGLVAALKGFCEEISKKHEVRVGFTARDVPQHLSRDISLGLFRVTQEALHNAVKYSGTSRFAVELTGSAGDVHLEVRDWGSGFDVDEAKRSRGLGLVSMQERVNLVGGRFSIESALGEGTRITAVVPLVAEKESPAEAEAVSQTGLP